MNSSVDDHFKPHQISNLLLDIGTVGVSSDGSQQQLNAALVAKNGLVAGRRPQVDQRPAALW